MDMEFAFGILKTQTTSDGTPEYTIRTANAQSGDVATAWDGPAPEVGPYGGTPWRLGGAILLGIGGDNSNWSWGTFFEGVITAGRPSDGTDAAVLANVQAAGYGR